MLTLLQIQIIGILETSFYNCFVSDGSIQLWFLKIDKSRVHTLVA